MKTQYLRRVLAGVCILVAGPGFSQTVTTQFTVQMTINGSCAIQSASNINFGATGTIASNIDNTGTIVVQCTNGTPYNLGLDAGSGVGATVANRLMTGPGGQTIGYSLYTNTARTTLWGHTIGSDTRTGTGSGANQSYTVYGRVPSQTVPDPGTYTDTVTATLTY